jgi:hypothetical protein
MPRKSPEPRPTDTALRRLHAEAKALLRDLETAAGTADGIALAGKFAAVMAAHVEPLRSAIDDVEFYDRAEQLISGLVTEPLEGYEKCAIASKR